MNEEYERQKVVEIAKSWIGTPYHHAGRVKGAGADCLTLLAEVYIEAGLVNDVHIPYYPQDWHLHRSEELYLSGLLGYTKEISDEPKAGDIILWKFGRCFSHGAIVIDYPTIIHSHIGVGCVFDDAEKSLNLKFYNEDKLKNKIRPRKIFSFWST